MKWLSAYLAVALSFACVVGCSEKSADPSPLRIAAASDLQTVMPVLVARFQLDSGIKVESVFGASGALSKQIQAGGPFDVFLAANRMFVDDLAQAGMIDANSVKPYARGVVVLAVSDFADIPVKGLADLANEKVRFVAIANPETAPYGAAAKQTLEKAGIWDAVKPKLVIAENVREAQKFVETGNAEVGIVSGSIGKTKGVRIIPIPVDACEPIVQSLGVVTASKQKKEAEEFTAFVLSDAGQGILRDFGFLSVDLSK